MNYNLAGSSACFATPYPTDRDAPIIFISNIHFDVSFMQTLTGVHAHTPAPCSSLEHSATTIKFGNGVFYR